MELASIADVMVRVLDMILLALLAYGAYLSFRSGGSHHSATRKAAHPEFGFLRARLHFWSRA
ncbi:MAG TPA: hypothetical protein VK143_04235 [Burkholderiales bacterium]|nr:hypothetical protein [Burkholderiales bacterium]